MSMIFTRCLIALLLVAPGFAQRRAVTPARAQHRDAPPAALLTGSYGECDHVIHDKFAMAQNRSPSDCEVKFDHMVREALDQALQPVTRYLQVVKQSHVKTITNIARHTEQTPYRLDSAPEGVFAIELQSTGSAMTQYPQRMAALTERIAAETRSGKAGGSMDEVTKIGYEMGRAPLSCAAAQPSTCPLPKSAVSAADTPRCRFPARRMHSPSHTFRPQRAAAPTIRVTNRSSCLEAGPHRHSGRNRMAGSTSASRPRWTTRPH